jgi:hypothetical protein
MSFTISLTAAAQDLDLDQNCVPITSIPPQCQQIANDIAAREEMYQSRIDSLEERLRETPPSDRADLQASINAVKQQRSRDRELIRLQSELKSCRKDNDSTPRRQSESSPLSVSFVGTVVTTTTHPAAGGPFSQDLNLGLEFSKNRCGITITRFPQISFLTSSTPVGRVPVTITKTGGGLGQFSPVTGEIHMPLSLLFHYDTIFAGDDTASVTLTTGRSISERGSFDLTGTPLNTASGTSLEGKVTLVGTTVFENGFLGGREGGFTITGDISIPRVSPPRPPSPARRNCLTRCEAFFNICLSIAKDERGEGSVTRAQCAANFRSCQNRCPIR